jgi:Ca2+-binding EF-hand superfamily protein
MPRLIIITASLLLSLFSSFVFAQEETQAGNRKNNFEHMLKRMDANGDGQVSREEWTRQARGFERLDRNNDGFITRDEASAALRRAEIRNRARKVFDRLDQNHDGQISRQEWRGKPRAFDRLDRNHDGSISPEELRHRRKARMKG